MYFRQNSLSNVITGLCLAVSNNGLNVKRHNDFLHVVMSVSYLKMPPEVKKALKCLKKCV